MQSASTLGLMGFTNLYAAPSDAVNTCGPEKRGHGRDSNLTTPRLPMRCSNPAIANLGHYPDITRSIWDSRGLVDGLVDDASQRLIQALQLVTRIFQGTVQLRQLCIDFGFFVD